MAEDEKDLHGSDGDSSTESAAPAGENPSGTQPRPLSHGQQRRRQRSVFQYIAVLFAAAFVLLLFTYIMDRRQYELIQDQNQAQIDDLLESASAVQRLDALYEENAALKNQIEELESQLEEANNQLDVLPDIISNQEHVLSETCRALDRFWQIDEAYVRGRYSLCRELIQEMEDTENGQTPLKDYLPKESTTDNGRFSPYDRYQEIYDALY